jgi:hypothetical protein
MIGKTFEDQDSIAGSLGLHGQMLEDLQHHFSRTPLVQKEEPPSTPFSGQNFYDQLIAQDGEMFSASQLEVIRRLLQLEPSTETAVKKLAAPPDKSDRVMSAESELSLEEALDVIVPKFWTPPILMEREFIQKNLSKEEIQHLARLLQTVESHSQIVYASSFQGGHKCMERVSGEMQRTDEYVDEINASFSKSNQQPLPFLRTLSRNRIGISNREIQGEFSDLGMIDVRLIEEGESILLVIRGKPCKDHASRSVPTVFVAQFEKSVQAEVEKIIQILKQKNQTSDVMLASLFQNLAKIPVSRPLVEAGFAHYQIDRAILNYTLAGSYPCVRQIVEPKEQL